MNLALRSAAAAASVAIVALLGTGCATSAGSSSPTPSATPDPMTEICADPFVVTCERGGGFTVVVIADDAEDESVLEFAPALFTAASASPDTVTLRRPADDATTLDPEVSAPPRWEVSVEAETDAAFEAALSETLVVAAVPGTTGIVTIDGWPSVTVETLDEFDDVFSRVSSTELFRDGGTYTLQSLDEQLRIVHVPTRTTDEAIHEIIDIARSYPDAEVLLEATTSGPQYPKLYVSRLGSDQVEAVEARLRAPRLASADVDGFPLEFVLSSLDEQGTTSVSGTFGDVPAG
ncbi:hypothetical protein [Microbacterium sp.]|uniref:hypothetical protein n=1 Tax=Microbacterium sp. TaxID=51671 RepID=UPI002FE05579